MIDDSSWPTPHGHRFHIMLEAAGLACRAIPVNIGAGDQFKPELLAISPNNKIPAITPAHTCRTFEDVARRIFPGSC